MSKRRKLVILEIFDYDPEIYALLTRNKSKVNESVYMKFDRFDFNGLCEQECEELFRFSKHDVLRLCELLELPDEIVLEDRNKTTGIEGLCVTLRRLTFPARWLDLEREFGRPRSTLSRIFKYVLNFIWDRKGHLLSDLDQNWIRGSLQEFADAIRVAAGPVSLRNCWAFIDGTVRHICRPSKHQKACYNGHKRMHALKYQSVLAPNGLVANMFGPVEGRRHDAGILRLSNLLQDLEDAEFVDDDGEPFSMYGDPAYPLRTQLIGPFKEVNITPEEAEFNKSMSSARIAVEWGFQKISTLFAFIDFKRLQKLRLQPVALHYLVAVILTNCHTCLYGGETSAYFDVEPPSLEEYLRG